MQSTKKLKGKVAVITGASSGIGLATALRFARAGSDVVLAARGEQALEAAAAACREHGVGALAVPADVTDDAAVEALARKAVERFGGIDVWVNNAGVWMAGAVETVPLDDIRRVLSTNVMGYVHGARAALRSMREQRRGVVINVSSAVGNLPQPYTAAYGMSKAATNALAVSLRSELRLDNLKDIHVVNVIAPAVDTPLFSRAANYSGRKARAIPPVYPAEIIAKAIVAAARTPRHEVLVGRGPKLMIKQYRAAPKATERLVAVHTDKTQLSRKETAPATSGNLYRSLTDDSDTVEGLWHGKRRSVTRKIVATGVVVGAAGIAVAVVRKAADKIPGTKTAAAAGKKAVKVAGKTGAGIVGSAAVKGLVRK